MRSRPVLNEQGDVVGAVEATLEITQRKRAEEALQESESRYRVFADRNPYGIQEIDTFGTIIYANKTHHEIYGYEEGKLIGRSITDFLALDSQRDELRDYLAMLVKEQPPPSLYHQKILTAQGKERDIEVTWNYLRDTKKRVRGFLSVLTDITDRKRIEQDLAVHHEKMQRAEQLASLGMVSATVAHELNQPLTVMRLFLQQGLRALKDDNDSDKVSEVIDDCLGELTKAASIVDRFRRFARKAAPVYIAKVNLVEIADGIVEILAESASREKLNLSVTVESCPPYIIGNSLELEQMFFVLIQNAIQAADGETWRELVITISSQGNQLLLTFADTCGGIRKEDIDKIFEPFFTTKPANLGTGLGLCILERIVKRHGGSVRVESEIGRGTIFYICLPIKS
jgi:histidine kinase